MWYPAPYSFASTIPNVFCLFWPSTFERRSISQLLPIVVLSSNYICQKLLMYPSESILSLPRDKIWLKYLLCIRFGRMEWRKPLTTSGSEMARRNRTLASDSIPQRKFNHQSSYKIYGKMTKRCSADDWSWFSRCECRSSTYTQNIHTFLIISSIYKSQSKTWLYYGKSTFFFPLTVFLISFSQHGNCISTLSTYFFPHIFNLLMVKLNRKNNNKSLEKCVINK